VRSSAHALPKRFVDEAFRMRQALTGQKKQRERYKRCISATDHALGELLAQPFIARRFAGNAKAAAKEMVLEIGKAFGRLVHTLDWMDDETKKASLDKLKKMAYLIGYPDKWRKYTFAVKDDYLANMLTARAFDLSRKLNKIGKPLDRDEWQMSPPTVNAYYDAQRNHMVFPAGILQPPFYDAKAGVAVNMGAMGMVVGHELTHGFDDKGSLFDGDGNMRAWWQKSVRKKFEARTKCVVDQYAGYEPLPGLKLNGKLTAGENIADIAGVKLAFSAYRAMRKDKMPMRANGYSEDQQFFLSTAQIWCSNRREAYTRMLAKLDPHSPPRFRVNGSLSNLPEFAKAFSCKADSAMTPKKRCTVW